MRQLIGKTIEKIYISDDNEQLIFITPIGEVFKYIAYGDCCSNSWFDSINNLKALLNHKVIKIQENDDDSKDEEKDGELIQVYSNDLITVSGTCTIEFRNSSNGYYGGWCEYLEPEENDDSAIGKLEKFANKENILLNGFREVTEDFPK